VSLSQKSGAGIISFSFFIPSSVQVPFRFLTFDPLCATSTSPHLWAIGPAHVSSGLLGPAPPRKNWCPLAYYVSVFSFCSSSCTPSLHYFFCRPRRPINLKGVALSPFMSPLFSAIIILFPLSPLPFSRRGVFQALDKEGLLWSFESAPSLLRDFFNFREVLPLFLHPLFFWSYLSF